MIKSNNCCFNILIDGRDVESFPPSYILQHGLFLAKYKKLTAQYIKKSAVICGPTMEKCLNLLFSVYTPESDMIVTQDFREGLIHVLDKKIKNKQMTIIFVFIKELLFYQHDLLY